MRVIALTLWVVCACGGATTTAPAAAAGAGAPDMSSPAAACIALANTPRASKAGQPAKIGVKHILVKWSGAKHSLATVTRSRDDACLRALQARDALRGGADFDAVVKDYSDEPGAVSRAGSLGVVERSALVGAFADAAFELAPGEFSDVVETEFGFHVISRTQ